MGEKFDEICQTTRDTYMDMSELPSTVVEGGKAASRYSTTLDAAEAVLDITEDQDKLTAIAELIAEQKTFDIFYELIDDTPKPKTMGQIMDELLVFILAQTIEEDPDVYDRSESNKRTFDALPPNEE
jgi:hypothetical protein